jgi:hypothetical protein
MAIVSSSRLGRSPQNPTPLQIDYVDFGLSRSQRLRQRIVPPNLQIFQPLFDVDAQTSNRLLASRRLFVSIYLDPNRDFLDFAKIARQKRLWGASVPWVWF